MPLFRVKKGTRLRSDLRSQPGSHTARGPNRSVEAYSTDDHIANPLILIEKQSTKCTDCVEYSGVTFEEMLKRIACVRIECHLCVFEVATVRTVPGHP